MWKQSPSRPLPWLFSLQSPGGWPQLRRDPLAVRIWADEGRAGPPVGSQAHLQCQPLAAGGAAARALLIHGPIGPLCFLSSQQEVAGANLESQGSAPLPSASDCPLSLARLQEGNLWAKHYRCGDHSCLEAACQRGTWLPVAFSVLALL